MLITSLLTIISLARSGSMLFYRAQLPQTSHTDTSNDTSSQQNLTPGFNGLAIVVCLLALCVALTIGAGAVSEFALATANQLLQPEGYVQSVLGAAR